jgi:hypothetical protein
MPSPQRLAGAKTVPAGGIATGVNAGGKPETHGFDVISAEDGHGRRPARRAILQPSTFYPRCRRSTTRRLWNSLNWAVGAGGGAVFGLLPPAGRHRP